MKAISGAEASKMLKSMTPEELKRLRHHARKRKGPRVLRDPWLAPLTMDPSRIDAMPHKRGPPRQQQRLLESEPERVCRTAGMDRKTKGRRDTRIDAKRLCRNVYWVGKLIRRCGASWSGALSRSLVACRYAGPPDRMKERKRRARAGLPARAKASTQVFMFE